MESMDPHTVKSDCKSHNVTSIVFTYKVNYFSFAAKIIPEYKSTHTVVISVRVICWLIIEGMLRFYSSDLLAAAAACLRAISIVFSRRLCCTSLSLARIRARL